MDRTRTIPRILFLTITALSLIGAGLRTVCMLTQFDSAIGYFDPALSVTLADLLYFIAAATAILAPCFIRRDTLPSLLCVRFRVAPALLLGVSLAGFTVVAFITCFPTRATDLMTIATVLGLLASTYFLVSAGRSGRYPDWLSLIGFLPVFWCLAAIADTYADPFTAMNSPVKLTLHLGLIGFLLILLAELRFRLGKPAPRVALCFLSLGLFFTLNGSLPILIATGAGILHNTLHLLYAAVLLCGGLYGGYMLYSYTFHPEDSLALSNSETDEETVDKDDASLDETTEDGSVPSAAPDEFAP